MKEIYLVSQGCYSDYGVIGVFEKKEDAQLFIDKFSTEDSYDKMEIEIRVLNPFIPELKQGLKSYRVRMEKNGNVRECERQNSVPSINVTKEFFFDIQLRLVVDCMAADNEHAIKIANERRIAALAENRWRK
jgi:hypothetical protein